jgi:hypothetical protein
LQLTCEEYNVSKSNGMTKRMIYKAYDNEVKKKKYERKAGE